MVNRISSVVEQCYGHFKSLDYFHLMASDASVESTANFGFDLICVQEPHAGKFCSSTSLQLGVDAILSQWNRNQTTPGRSFRTFQSGSKAPPTLVQTMKRYGTILVDTLSKDQVCSKCHQIILTQLHAFTKKTISGSTNATAANHARSFLEDRVEEVEQICGNQFIQRNATLTLGGMGGELSSPKRATSAADVSFASWASRLSIAVVIATLSMA
jgi:hypothetical protein